MHAVPTAMPSMVTLTFLSTPHSTLNAGLGWASPRVITMYDNSVAGGAPQGGGGGQLPPQLWATIQRDA